MLDKPGIWDTEHKWETGHLSQLEHGTLDIFEAWDTANIKDMRPEHGKLDTPGTWDIRQTWDMGHWTHLGHGTLGKPGT